MFDENESLNEGTSMSGTCVLSTKKKILIGVLIAVISALLIVCVYLFAPDPMPVDWSKIKKIPSNVTLLEADDIRNSTDDVALVKLNKDGTADASDWNVLQFTDLHFTQDDERNDVSLNLMIDTLKREKPDFVVLTGDIITRPRGRARAVQLAEIFEKMGIYWCYCLGNHEGDSTPYTLSREENVRIWAAYPHCLLENDVKKTEDGVEIWGLGNTVVNLLGADFKVVQSMIFLDSGSTLRYGDEAMKKDAADKGVSLESYDYLKDSQMKWYEEKVRAVTGNLTNGVKTMLFIHIPLVEMSNVTLLPFTEVLPEGWHYADPENPYYVGDNLYGNMIVKDGWELIGNTGSFEKCYCSDYNSGMYDVMKSLRAGVNGLFCGHDHISNSVLYEPAMEGENNVYLCYGVCGGLQSYNLYDYGLSENDDYSLRGYAKIVIKEDCSFSLYHFRYNDLNNPLALIENGKAN